MNRRTFLRSAGAAIAGGTIAPALLPAAMLDPRGPGQPAAAPGENLPSDGSYISAVVYDERYHDCRLFADALVARGAVAFPTRGDSAALWYGPLRARVAAQNSGMIAGFTTEAERHVSQSCGRELAFALLYEGAHDSRRRATGQDANIAHRFRAVSCEVEIAAAPSASHELAPCTLSSVPTALPPSLMLLAMPASQAVIASQAVPASLSSRSWPVALAGALGRVAPAHAQSRIVPGSSSFAPVSALSPRSPDYPGYLTSWLLGPAA
jgi:hypothetical protein